MSIKPLMKLGMALYRQKYPAVSLFFKLDIVVLTNALETVKIIQFQTLAKLL